MPFIIFQIFLILIIPLVIFGQSEKPQTIVVPAGSLGKISEIKVKILEKSLESELDEYFAIVPKHLFEEAQEKAFEELDYEECTEEQCIMMIQEMLQVENAFQLTLISDEGDTQLSLNWTNLDEKRVEEIFCEGCKTKELRKSVSLLVQKLVKESIDPEEILRRKKEEEILEKIESAFNIASKKNTINSFKYFIDFFEKENLAKNYIILSEKSIEKIKIDLEKKKVSEQIKKERDKVVKSYQKAIKENKLDVYEEFIRTYKSNTFSKIYINEILKRKRNLEKVNDLKDFEIKYFPLPDPSKQDTLLIIPVSITSIFKMKYFDKFGVTFVRDNDEKQLKFTYSLSHYQNKDYILIENIEPGKYYIQSVSFISGYGKVNEKKNYHDGSKGFERRYNRGNLKFSKNPIRFELKDNHVTIPKFKIEFWEEKKNGRCCSVYLYLINNIDDLSRNLLIDELKKLENFNKWKHF